LPRPIASKSNFIKRICTNNGTGVINNMNSIEKTVRPL
jgi:hypothetical protein